MYKERIKYIDYNGVEKEEDFYFNLNKAELIKMSNIEGGGSLSDMLTTLIDAQDVSRMIDVLEDLICTAYGKRTPDGRFVKNQEVLDEFKSSAAYSDLFMELATNDEKASAFVNGIIPDDMVKEINDDIAVNAAPAEVIDGTKI